VWDDFIACVAEIGPIYGDAYGIVPIDISFQEFLFTHEIGHIFGAQHQPSTNSEDCSYRHTLQFNIGTPDIFIKNTIMKGGDRRIPYFSSPLSITVELPQES